MSQFSQLRSNAPVNGFSSSLGNDGSSQEIKFTLFEILNRVSGLEIAAQNRAQLISEIKAKLISLESSIASLVSEKVEKSLEQFQKNIMGSIKNILEQSEFERASNLNDGFNLNSNVHNDAASIPFSHASNNLPHRNSVAESFERQSSRFDPIDLQQEFDISTLTDPVVLRPDVDLPLALPSMKYFTKKAAEVDLESKTMHSNSKVTPFEVFYSIEEVSAGLDDGSLFQGIISINKRNRQEASVKVGSTSGSMKVLILGENARNRSLEGDSVIIKLLPEDAWKAEKEFKAELVSYQPADCDYSVWAPDAGLVPSSPSYETDMFDNFNVKENIMVNKQESFAEITGRSKFYGVDQPPALPQRIPTGKVVAIMSEETSQGLKLRTITRRAGQPIVGFLVPRYGFDNPKLTKGEPLPKTENTVEFRPLDNRFPFLMIQRDELPKEFVSNPFSFKSPAEKLVVCSIKGWFENFRFPLGRFIEILGDSYNINAETRTLIIETSVSKNLEQFPENILRDIRKQCASHPENWAPSDRDLRGRMDLRKEPTFSFAHNEGSSIETAYHCKEVDNDLIEIGVHVSDVSAFVHENTDLDLLVFNRGKTVELVNQSLPMLPSELSNAMCSLLPGKERLTFSCVYYLKKDGSMSSVSPKFFPSCIKSCSHIELETANSIFRKEYKFDDFPDLSSELRASSSNSNDVCNLEVLGNFQKGVLCDSVRLLLDIANLKLESQYTTEEGFISHGFSVKLNEVNLGFGLDSSGEPSQVISHDIHPIADSLQLIRSVSNFLVAQQLLSNGKHFALLLRQEPPEIEDEFFWQIMVAYGLPDPRTAQLSPEHFQRALANVSRKIIVGNSQMPSVRHRALFDRVLHYFSKMEGKTANSIFSFLVKKALRSPEYFVAEANNLRSPGASDQRDSHWMLNTPYFTTFTSPVSSYADLTVQRLLKISLSSIGNKNPGNAYLGELQSKLRLIAHQCNARFEQAKEAKRRSTMLFLCSLVKKRTMTRKYLETRAVVLQFGQKNLTLFLPDFFLVCKVNVFVDWHADEVATHFHEDFVLRYRTDQKDETKIIEPTKDQLEKSREKIPLYMNVKFGKESTVILNYGVELKILLKPQVERKRVLGFRTDFIALQHK